MSRATGLLSPIADTRYRLLAAGLLTLAGVGNLGLCFVLLSVHGSEEQFLKVTGYLIGSWGEVTVLDRGELIMRIFDALLWAGIVLGITGGIQLVAAVSAYLGKEYRLSLAGGLVGLVTIITAPVAVVVLLLVVRTEEQFSGNRLLTVPTNRD